MVSKLKTSALVGLEAIPVEIEIDIQPGLPSIQIVGLPDTSVKESKDRIKSAIINSNYKFPLKKIIVNLAPARIKKEGNLFDLPIALGILKASNQLSDFNFDDTIFLGELSLDGRVRAITGALNIALYSSKKGYKKIVLPIDNLNETALITNIDIFPIESLMDCVSFINNPFEKKPILNMKYTKDNIIYNIDFKEVKGQMMVKRAIEIACAGNHNIILIGPPGSGKTMIAKRIPTILPEMSLDEALETCQIYSMSGLIKQNSNIIFKRPFRDPHHTASDVSIIGGGSYPKPGEVSLAHNGVLFLDEFPEFKNNVLQVLREPLEEKKVTISRSERCTTFPARFMLVASMNPCPCGYLTHPEIECRCSEKQIRKYLSKISGPILDRIDLQIDVPRLDYEELLTNKEYESSKEIKNRILKAREIQIERYKKFKILTNSDISKKLIEKYCNLKETSKKILKISIEKMGLSARALDKILKVSRTIADLDNREQIEDEDIFEALQYRSIDKIIK